MVILGIFIGAWFFGAILTILWVFFVAWIENIPLTDSKDKD